MTPAARERRFRRIKELGCIIARRRGWWMAAEIHHLNLGAHAGQKRRGDEFTIGLNSWSHRGVPLPGMTATETRKILGPSLAREPNRFRAAFGSDDDLLEEQNSLIDARERLANSAARPLSRNLANAVQSGTGDAAADLGGEG